MDIAEDSVTTRAHILGKLFENFHVWRSMVEEQGTEILQVRGHEFNFFDTMRHVERLPKDQQVAIEYLRLGVSDRDLKKMGLIKKLSDGCDVRQAALAQLAVWSLAEDGNND